MHTETQTQPTPYIAPEVTDLGEFIDPATVGVIIGSAITGLCQGS